MKTELFGWEIVCRDRFNEWKRRYFNEIKSFLKPHNRCISPDPSLPIQPNDKTMIVTKARPFKLRITFERMF